jgi:hypothetical protein
MKTYQGSGVTAPLILNVSLGEDEWLTLLHSCCTPGERAPSAHWKWGIWGEVCQRFEKCALGSWQGLWYENLCISCTLERFDSAGMHQIGGYVPGVHKLINVGQRSSRLLYHILHRAVGVCPLNASIWWTFIGACWYANWTNRHKCPSTRERLQFMQVLLIKDLWACTSYCKDMWLLWTFITDGW